MVKIYNNSKKGLCVFSPKTRKVGITVIKPAGDKYLMQKYTAKGSK